MGAYQRSGFDLSGQSQERLVTPYGPLRGDAANVRATDLQDLDNTSTVLT